MSEPVPTLGRIVHFSPVKDSGIWYAAIVSGDCGRDPCLAVFDEDFTTEHEVPHEADARDAGRCWRWPPRV